MAKAEAEAEVEPEVEPEPEPEAEEEAEVTDEDDAEASRVESSMRHSAGAAGSWKAACVNGTNDNVADPKSDPKPL